MSTPTTSDLTPLGKAYVLGWLEVVIARDGIATPDDLSAALKAAAAGPDDDLFIVDKAAERLEHPGEWLPGDQITDSDGDVFTRDEHGIWRYEEGTYFRDDYLVETIVGDPDNGAHITHLVPRSEVD